MAERAEWSSQRALARPPRPSPIHLLLGPPSPPPSCLSTAQHSQLCTVTAVISHHSPARELSGPSQLPEDMLTLALAIHAVTSGPFPSPHRTAKSSFFDIEILHHQL